MSGRLALSALDLADAYFAGRATCSLTPDDSAVEVAAPGGTLTVSVMSIATARDEGVSAFLLVARALDLAW